MRIVLVGLALLMLAACSLLPQPPGPRAQSWTGTVTLTSSSVPNPYNWTRTVDISGTTVNGTASWFPTDSKTDRGTKQTWQRTLTEAEVISVDTAIKALSRPGKANQVPGACGVRVDLRASDGTQVKISDTAKGENYASIRALYALLAGPDDPTLPAHSYKC